MVMAWAVISPTEMMGDLVARGCSCTLKFLVMT
jgi:hypothetical protein